MHEAPVTGEELLAEIAAAGVDRALLVQAGGAYRNDNSYIADVRAAHPDRFGAVAIVDAEGPDPAAELAGWVDRGVGGVRLFAVRGPAPWLTDGSLDGLVELARERSVRVCAVVMPELLADLDGFLAAHPDLVVALDHCGFDPVGVRDLAHHDGLRLKITTCVLDMVDDPSATLADLVDRFGAERVMWGSDYSQTHDRPYPVLVDQARAASAGLSPGARERYLGGTALELWPELG